MRELISTSAQLIPFSTQIHFTFTSADGAAGQIVFNGSYTGTNWGNASGSWVTGTGNGAAQTLTVYGVVAAGLYPTAGSYGDSVTVTLTY